VAATDALRLFTDDNNDVEDPTFQPGARHRLYLTSGVLGVEQAGRGQVFFCLRLEGLSE
jgi:hypothetical protein